MSKEIKEIETNLSQDDINWLNEKPLKSLNDGIGFRKYEYLYEKRQKSNNYSLEFPNKQNPYQLSELEQQQITEFESKKFAKHEPTQKEIDYWDKILSNSKKNDFTNVGLAPDKKVLYKAFKLVFKNVYQKEFEETTESLLNLAVVINYFSKNDDFFKSTLLVRELDDKPLNNSFNKGLLIVGGYGCGKTTILEVLSIVIDHYFKESYNGLWNTHLQWRSIKYKFAHCHRVVTEFEGLSSPEDRVLFMDKYSNPKFCFDDLTKEKPASNYGVKNIFQEVLEKRYDKKSITHVTMNYSENYPNNIHKAIDFIGEKYGGHNYDRIKQMFNIVEFKGKSFRK